MSDNEEEEVLARMPEREAKAGRDDDNKMVMLRKIPQGAGSGLDTDTVHGLKASKNPTPNNLVPLNDDGVFEAKPLTKAILIGMLF